MEAQILMLVRSLSFLCKRDKEPKSSEWMKKNLEWLKHTSLYGIDMFLASGERKGYFKSVAAKDNSTLLYSTTEKGRRQAQKVLGE